MQHPGSLLPTRALAFGGVYHAEQTNEATWIEDIRLMRKAGVNLVSLAVFAWGELEVEDGRFDFEWLDHVLGLLHHADIRVVLATATSTPPTWLVRKHPEMRPVTADGRTLDVGARQVYCPSSPVWREHVARMARVMAERYADHPAVALWQVSHEYSDHVGRCFCDASTEHFQAWLKTRYGSLDALNTAWGTSNWSQRITAWSDVTAPRTTVNGPQIPGQLLDFERFSSDAFIELFEVEREVLTEVCPDAPVTTHFISLRRDIDYWRFAEHVDVIADNAYPDPADPFTHETAALNYDLMRSLKGGDPWLMLEHPMSAVAWRDVNPPKPVGQARLTTLQAIAHGADAAVYNQWRQSRFGAEQFHSAVLGSRGERSRTYQEFCAIGHDLERLAPVAATRVDASVAVLVDWESWWASSSPEILPSSLKSWLDTTRAWHAALAGLGHTLDVVRAGSDLGKYRAVAVPNLMMVTPKQAEALVAYVAQGGHLIVGAFSGVVDVQGHTHLGGAPGPLRDLLGLEVEEFWPLSEGARVTVQLAERFDSQQLTAHTWSEWIDAAPDTEVIASFSSGDLVGRPALTRNTLGAGEAWYIGFDGDRDGLAGALELFLADSGIAPGPSLPRTVEVVARADDAQRFTFVLNHDREPVTVSIAADLGVPGAVRDLLGAQITSDALTLDGFGVAVLTGA